jgi:hypothetical protein
LTGTKGFADARISLVQLVRALDAYKQEPEPDSREYGRIRRLISNAKSTCTEDISHGEGKLKAKLAELGNELEGKQTRIFSETFRVIDERKKAVRGWNIAALALTGMIALDCVCLTRFTLALLVGSILVIGQYMKNKAMELKSLVIRPDQLAALGAVEMVREHIAVLEHSRWKIECVKGQVMRALETVERIFPPQDEKAAA